MHFDLARLHAELCKRRDFRELCRALAHFLHRHQHWAHENLHAVYFGLGTVKFWTMEGTVAAGLCGVSASLFVLTVLAMFEGE